MQPVGPATPSKPGYGSADQPSSVVVSRGSVTAAPAKAPVRDQWGTPPPGYIPGRGRGATGFAGGVSRDDTLADQDRGDYNDRNYDEFNGYNEALFRDVEYDEEDRQADILYDNIEVMMDMRRRSKREERLKQEIARLRAEKPTIRQQFSDLKTDLAGVTPEEWEAIPDIGDPSLRSKQKKPSRMQRAPDNLLVEAAAARMASGMATPIEGSTPLPHDVGGLVTPMGTPMANETASLGIATPFGLATPHGLSTPFGLATPMGLATPFGLATPVSTPLKSAGGVVTGLASELTLGGRLDSVIQSASSKLSSCSSVIDPKGYLTALQTMSMGGTDLVNIGKARSLMKSIVSTNPNNPQGWIAYARLEERANRMSKARDIIAEGCSKCSREEEVWLEAARLHINDEANLFLTVAVKKFLPNSVRLWVERANREKDTEAKRDVLRQALSKISNSVRLWTEAVSLENDINARLLLLRAVECVPQAVELWLWLARVSAHDDARKALNEARKNCPTSTEIWVAASELEENRGNAPLEFLTKLLSTGLKKLQDNDVTFDHSVWLSHAEQCEKSGHMRTTEAIIQAMSNHDIHEANDIPSEISKLKKSRLEDAERLLQQGSVATARALLYFAAHSKSGLVKKKSIWLALIDLEEKAKNDEGKLQTLKEATQAIPEKELFWLMLAKHLWVNGNVEAARNTLKEAMNWVMDKEGVILASVKVERELGNITEARELLRSSRENLDTGPMWIHSVQLERRVGNYDEARNLVAKAITSHPTEPKLWMIACAIETELSKNDTAADLIKQGCKQLPKNSAIWQCAIDCQIFQENYPRARAIREKATILLPGDEMIWFKAINIEQADPMCSKAVVKQTINKALQDCPKSGLLWSEAVWSEDTVARTSKAAEALSASDNHPYCVLAAARLFWSERKEKKAREWFLKARDLGPRYGDIYGAHLAFELQYKRKKEIADIFKAAAASEPNQGVQWLKCVKKVENWSKTIPQIIIGCLFAVSAKKPIELTDKNFDSLTQIGSIRMTTGDWFIKFYAPWCGHCKNMANAWEELASLSEHLNIADVDATVQVGIAKRFNITGYPTLLFIKENKVRRYKGPREAQAMLDFTWEGYKSVEAYDAPSASSALSAKVKIHLAKMVSDADHIWNYRRAGGILMLVLGCMIGLSMKIGCIFGKAAASKSKRS